MVSEQCYHSLHMIQVVVLNHFCPGTKEAASACNHSLMKLVTPEDDEDEEEGVSTPPKQDSPPKTEADGNGECFSLIGVCLPWASTNHCSLSYILLLFSHP